MKSHDLITDVHHSAEQCQEMERRNFSNHVILQKGFGSVCGNGKIIVILFLTLCQSALCIVHPKY